MAEGYGRKIAVVPSHLDAFEHTTLVLPPLEFVAESKPVNMGKYIAWCVTRRPAFRCECGMYDLAWDVTVTMRG